jgi:hypothetical protein
VSGLGYVRFHLTSFGSHQDRFERGALAHPPTIGSANHRGLRSVGPLRWQGVLMRFKIYWIADEK